jgi:thioredoxin-like negative regulator of GroEL
VSLAAAGVWTWKQAPPAGEVLIRAEEALADGDLERATALAGEAAELNPLLHEARLVGAEAQFAAGRADAAIETLGAIPESADSSSVSAHLAAARLCDRYFQPTAAERHYRNVLNHRPDDIAAHRELAWLLTVMGRRWDSAPHLLALLKRQEAQLNELLLLLYLGSPFEDRTKLERYRAAAPDDPQPLIALAQDARQNNERAAAIELLETALRRDPELLEGQAWLGQLLYEEQDWDRLASWAERLPDRAATHPRIWVVRGLSAAMHGDDQGAARCFWEALRIDPNDQTANQQLGLVLQKLGRTQDAEPFLERTPYLAELSQIARHIYEAVRDSSANAPRAMARAAELTAALGRDRESAAWRIMLGTQGATWSAEFRLGQDQWARLAGDAPQTAADHNPALQIDLSGFPMPDIIARVDSPPGLPDSLDRSGVQFEDQSLQAGLEFRYFNGHEPNSAGMPIYQTTGGGVGVIDFDADLWPDLYFTQGTVWPDGLADNAYVDALYRNRSGRQLVNITAAAHLGDELFSQGISAGDVNSDGFADLLVANLGRNRLYLNLGDGTFADGTLDAGLQGDEWTSSCAIADLNGDSHPDLFEVNYIDHHQSDVTVLCPDETQTLRTCGPTHFPPAEDRLWLNDGTGTFHDATGEAGISNESGYGLGIVIADWGGSGQAAVFVANDMSANSWWINSQPRGRTPSFADQAVAAGLAYDSRGVALACMGVAAADVNEDGVIDLFVTNSFNQSNTLYLSDSGGFTDATIAARLFAPSLKFVGFGTQFIDAELDGHSDLIVTNGHLDDMTHLGQPFKMNAQFFSNAGNATFAERAATHLGPFFAQEYLGRGLARLDWDRDGRDDAAISHIGDPAALLTNSTPDRGHYVAFRLVGAASDRDAICARVTIRHGHRAVTQQLTAGDGYQCSNQKCIRFGLGATDQIDEVTVRWPSGRTDLWGPVTSDEEYFLVEGAEEPVSFPPSHP